MSPTHNSLRIVGLMAGLIVCATAAEAATWQAFGGTGSGNWNDPNHWDTANAPDTVSETAQLTLVITSPPGPHIITVYDLMYPSGLTTGSITFNTGGTLVSNARFTEIQATGTSSTLNWTVGDVATPGRLNMYRHQLTLNNVNMNFAGTSVGAAILLSGLANGLTPPVAQDWNLDATNSTISITNAPVGTNFPGIAVQGGAMRMTGGTLTVTNGSNNGQILVDVADGTTGNRSVLTLSGSQMTTNSFVVSNTGIFNFNGTGAAGPSSITGTLEVRAGEANLVGGTLNVGSALLNFPTTTASGTINVTGATLNVTGGFDIKSTASTPTAAFPNALNISAGSVNAASMEAGGTSLEKSAYSVNLSGTGSLALAGTLLLGFDDFSGRHGAGTVVMTGGSLSASSLIVGAAIDATPNSLGFYEQTGGTSTFGSVVLNRDNTTPSGYGTQEFVVGAGATMNITGAGFSKVGTGDWHVDDTPGNLNFNGKLVFNPSSAITQTLLAFGKEEGEYELYADDLTPAILGNYGVGTLDVSNLNGSEKLFVSAAGNFATNALYVNALVGLSSGNVTTLLDSPINIYYNTAYSPGLLGLTYQLTSGGELIPLTALVPAAEPNSLLLLSLGSLALVGRSRRRLARAK